MPDDRLPTRQPPPQTSRRHSYLKRLPPAAYRGLAAVHWSMTIKARGNGWLGGEFHLRFREILLHTLARHHLVCPAYCLMPDHLHLLWLGVVPDTDQRQASKFFREHLNPLLNSAGTVAHELQKQAHDHVLRQSENGPDAVRAVAWYIFENPVRAGLVSDAAQWPYLGAMMPGFPKCDPMAPGFWEWFWRMRERLIEEKREPHKEQK